MIQEKSTDFRHVLPIQIRFNDVDKFGHVNNTIYFQFYDTAKTDYFAAVCPNVDWETVAIVVVKIEAEFLSQIKAGEHISARTRVTKIGNKSFQLDQDIINTDTQERLGSPPVHALPCRLAPRNLPVRRPRRIVPYLSQARRSVIASRRSS